MKVIRVKDLRIFEVIDPKDATTLSEYVADVAGDQGGSVEGSTTTSSPTEPPKQKRGRPRKNIEATEEALDISGTEVKKRLRALIAGYAETRKKQGRKSLALLAEILTKSFSEDLAHFVMLNSGLVMDPDPWI